MGSVATQIGFYIKKKSAHHGASPETTEIYYILYFLINSFVSSK